IAVTVITFLFWGSSVTNRANGGGSQSNYDFGTIEGQPVSREDFMSARTDARLMFLCTRGEWIDSDSDAQKFGVNLDQETYQRLFIVKRAQAMGIKISEEKISQMAGQVLANLGGKQGPVPLDAFEKQVLKTKGLTLADFRRALETQSSIQELVAVIGQNGKLVTPQEAEATLRREAEEISTVAAFFPVTNFLASASVTPENVSEFYTKQLAAYRQPDRRQVSYVKFKAADFFAEADKKIAGDTNLPVQIDRAYEARGSNYYAGKTAAEAKAEIRADYRRSLAVHSAREVAAKFGEDLLNLSPIAADNLDKLAAAQKLTVEISSPFAADKAPVELDVPTTFARAAFALTAEEPFDGRPTLGEDAAYVIALKKQIPSGVPALETIREQVTADCKLFTAAQLANTAGSNFAAKVSSSVGKNFADICAEAKVTPVKLPAFSLLTRALPEAETHVAFGLLQNLAMGLPVGGSSGYRPLQGGGGLVLQVTARTPADDAKIKTELPAFIGQARQQRSSELFNAWFQKEASVALANTPIAKRQK
ncbi:MAG: Peptidyl-prolyl cis-trans isomerase, partial [Verrucomicrobiota bacterium]